MTLHLFPYKESFVFFFISSYCRIFKKCLLFTKNTVGLWVVA
jgi:hypothetical protein